MPQISSLGFSNILFSTQFLYNDEVLYFMMKQI